MTNQDKSINLDENKLDKISDANIKMSLQLQKVFGLRKEESIKIKIHEAVIGDKLVLHGSWCKNGRSRTLEIRTAEQRMVVETCKQFVGQMNCALIPNDKNYYQQMKKYENELAKVGISKAHGLRHAYAQQRYKELTGWECPAKGGPTKNQLTAKQLSQDRRARQIISEDLAHERISIVAIYVGR